MERGREGNTIWDRFANRPGIRTDGATVVAKPLLEAGWPYKTDGRRDVAFGGDGKVTTQFATGSKDAAFGMAIQADGRIVAAGQSSPSDYSMFALTRYLAA